MRTQRLTLLAATALLTPALFGQNVMTHHFTAALSPSNENPALDAQAVGDAHVLIKAYRNSSGDLIQARVDFNIDYYVEGEMLVAMHIHRGAAGVNGPVLIDSDLMGPIDAAGSGKIFRQAVVTEPEGLETVENILTNPAGYYLNLHSISSPPGLIRGQLQRTPLSMIQMTNQRNESIEAKIDAMKGTLERIAGRLGVVPVEVEDE